MLSMMNRLPDGAVYDDMNSPIGRLTLIASEKGIHALLWEKDREDPQCNSIIEALPKKPKHLHIKTAKSQLKEYFAGKRTDFDLPIVMDGTPFQKSAWKQLTKIPYGKTISYQQQAKALGDVKKVRAVGGANGRNPISIIVPCHRVIAKSGGLTGFGGGLNAKKFLIELENR